MNIPSLLCTVSHLRIQQIVYQIRYRLFTPRFRSLYAPDSFIPQNIIGWIPKAVSYCDGQFMFLNLSAPFRSWQDVSKGMLWAYNLNYMDWLCQSDMDFEVGAEWIERFISDLPNNAIGLQSYPIALRGINWIKFIAKYNECLPASQRKHWNDALYSQYEYLSHRLEYHLLGNHLLEDAFSLYMAAIYFRDYGFYRCSSKLLRAQLEEQILSDGAHYEQSPMYHCILLDRLLDCYNFSSNSIAFERQEAMTALLARKACHMLGYLENIVWTDGTIPLLNDSAYDIAPIPAEIFEYACRLGLRWQAIPLGVSGYRKFKNEHIEAIVDVGNIASSYQPGHTHADTFNYELRINGEPFIVDTGISTYEKNNRRQYERSTAAHNTVSIGGGDSSEVWGGFRVGRRAKVAVLKESSNRLTACHDGFGAKHLHTREFVLSAEQFDIIDKVTGKTEAIVYLHFAPGVKILDASVGRIVTNRATVYMAGADKMEIDVEQVSTEYNRFRLISVAKIYFHKTMTHVIACK